MPLPSDQKINDWKQKLKDKWKYGKTQVIYEDKNGHRVTPIPSTVATTTTAARPNVTAKPTDGTLSPSVVTINITTTTKGPHTGEVINADVSTLIKTVGITCGAFIGLILLIVICICCCRRQAAKRNRRLTIRRPLNQMEPEVDHIYAEIEPLQRPSDSGASGTSADIHLPQKKKKSHKAGVSSIRALSTRIYKFFSVDEGDDQTVFYNRSGHEESANFVPPVPPERNGRTTKKTRSASRGASTASRRPLLDGDSVEHRSHIYNPLTREEKGRQSGPYDRLASKAFQVEGDEEPNSPHDYFTLQKGRKIEEPGESLVHSVETVNENVEDEIEIVDEKNVETVTEGGERKSKHDYFILEPHEKEEDTVIGKSADVSTPGKSGSVKATSKSVGGNSSEGASKPEPKPRVSKQTSENVQFGSNPSSPVKQDKPSETITKTTDSDNNVRKSVDEVYVLSKMGEAPLPPPGSGAGAVIGSEGDDIGTDEYLTPKDVHKPDYIIVLPEPPLRTSSLPLEDKNHSNEEASTKHTDSPTKRPKTPTGRYESLIKHSESPQKTNSPSRKSGSPSKHSKSASKHPKSPSQDSKSPVKHKMSPDVETPQSTKETLEKKESIITDV